MGRQSTVQTRSLRPRIVSPGYEYYCRILLVLLYRTYGKLKSLGIYPSNSATTESTAVSHPVQQWYHARPLCEVLPIIMGDFTNHGGNLTNAIKGLKTIDGRTPAIFRDWHKKLAVVLGVTRRDIANLIKGLPRPTEETTGTGISPALAGFDRANEDLYAVCICSQRSQHRF